MDKQCRTCEVPKPPDQFAKGRADCKECERAFRSSPEGREQERQRKAAYRKRHPERSRQQSQASYEANKEAVNDRARQWAAANPEKARQVRRNSNLLREYGITLDEYEAMFAACKGLCVVCKQPGSGKRTSLCVDHNRDTGQVRDLLCHNCNVVLGLVHESPERLRALASYLEHWNDQWMSSASNDKVMLT